MREKIEILQVGRALAAIAVVLQHATTAAGAFGSAPPAALTSVLLHGYLGVDFFFALSGFIIHSAHRADPRSLRAAKTYCAKRLARIYVPYLPVSCAMVALYSLFPHLSAADRDWSLTTSITLWPTTYPPAPALIVAWTLSHEMLFYLVYLARYFFAFAVPLLAAWALAIILHAMTGASPNGLAPFFALALAPINLEFIAGVAAASIVGRVNGRYALPLMAIGLLGAAGALAAGVDDAGAVGRVAFGISCAIVIAGAVLLERAGRLRPPAFAILLGDASYAIYLLHDPAISVVARIVGRLHFWPAMLSSSLVAGTVAGLLYHLTWEAPALTWCSRRIRAAWALATRVGDGAPSPARGRGSG